MDLVSTHPGTISAWSFSRLVEVYEKCGLRAKFEFVDKRPKPQPAAGDKAAIASARGKAIHKGAEAYVKGEGVLIRELDKPEVVTQLERYRSAYADGFAVVEEQWGYDRDWQPTSWFGDQTWLRVACDVVMQAQSVVEINDWKSGTRFGNEVKHSQQGILYAIATLIRYPEADAATIRFTYVDENKSISKTYDRATVMRLMPSWDARGKAMTSDTQFRAKPNKSNCRFCPYGPNVGDRSCPVGVEV